MRAAVDCLHEINYVFGDLRLQNVMVHEDKIKLVDFDWAGIHGQAKYPAQMNMENIRWPQGVGPREIMLKKHDIDMLNEF
jgi:serine/threonine protein kinase